jgi:hypothetical protein
MVTGISIVPFKNRNGVLAIYDVTAKKYVWSAGKTQAREACRDSDGRLRKNTDPVQTYILIAITDFR